MSQVGRFLASLRAGLPSCEPQRPAFGAANIFESPNMTFLFEWQGLVQERAQPVPTNPGTLRHSFFQKMPEARKAMSTSRRWMRPHSELARASSPSPSPPLMHPKLRPKSQNAVRFSQDWLTPCEQAQDAPVVEPQKSPLRSSLHTLTCLGNHFQACFRNKF